MNITNEDLERLKHNRSHRTNVELLLIAEIERLRTKPCSGACLLKSKYAEEDLKMRALLLEGELDGRCPCVFGGEHLFYHGPAGYPMGTRSPDRT